MDAQRTAPLLAVCPRCGADACQPLALIAGDGGEITAQMICPVCDHERVEPARPGDVRRYARFVEETRSVIRKGLEAAERESFMGDAYRFAQALQDDRILPEDF